MIKKYEFKTEPYEHQKQALRQGWNRPYFAYFMEMGTGKTKVAIDNTAILYENDRINGAVILAPKGVYLNWIDQLGIHFPDRIDYDLGVWASPPNQRIIKSLHRAANSVKLGILLINIEAVNSPKGYRLIEGFLRARQCIMIIDESTKIKNIKSKVTKKTQTLGGLALYRRIMTGSPIVNNPLDMYGQSEFLMGGLISRSESGFKNTFCVTKKMQVQGIDKRTKKPRTFTITNVVGAKNQKQLSDKIDEFAYRARKSDCLDLPDKIYERYEVEMTMEQKKIYDDMRDVAYHQMEHGEEISVSIAISQMLRLHQIVCGHVKDDEGNIHSINNNRIKALEEVIEQTDEQIIIWANYIHDVDKIAQFIKERYGPLAGVLYTGSTTQEKRATALESMKTGASRFFIANPQTAGYGLTMTEVTTHIYYSNNYSLELRMQSEDRSHRIGQHNKVTYIDLVTPKSVDEKIIYALRNKIDIASAILKDGPQSWLI